MIAELPDNELTRWIIACATEVHDNLGPGLHAEVYEARMASEMSGAGLPFQRARVLPLIYEGQQLDFIQTDFIVGTSVILQVEAAEAEYTHQAQLRTSIWAGEFPVGLLLNFNVARMRDGISRVTRQGDVAVELPAAFLDVFDDPDLGAANLN
jgi:GxxExxY protein